MKLALKGRKAFVTGASRGIGAAIVRALAAEGVSVALFGRDIAGCKKLARELKAKHAGANFQAFTLDLEQPAAIASAISKAGKALGGCDILVNCAGGAYRGRLEDIADEAWDSNFKVKPLGLMRVTRACLPLLRVSTQARIINIGGTRGREPAPFSVMSAPINMATMALTKAMANELGPQGITVNAINPGSTDTGRWTELVDMTAHDRKLSKADAEKYLNREVPLGRVVMPDDIANLAVFLSSALAAMISGVAVNVDGGRTRSI